MTGKELTAALAANSTEAEKAHLATLEQHWRVALERAADRASVNFALVAQGGWQPPPEGAVLTVAQIAALAAALNEKLLPVWRMILTDVARAPLASIGIVWDGHHPLFAGQIEAAAKRTGARLGEAAQLELRKVIADAYATDLDVRATSAAIQAAIKDAAPWQADALARTDLNSLANGASKSAAQLTGIGYKTWLTAGDDKVREAHAEAEGQTVPINGVFTVGGENADYPGDPQLSDAEAINCIAEGAEIELPGLRAAMRRWYEGDLVRLCFSGDDHLTVTPNHPILRSDGRWIPAGKLMPGDHCIGRSLGGHAMTEPDVDHPPAEVSEVYGAATCISEAIRVGARPGWLHGDVADGDVDVVAIDRELVSTDVAASEQHLEELGLTLADRASAGCRDFVLPSYVTASGSGSRSGRSTGVVGSSRQAPPFTDGGLGHSHVHGFAATTWIHPSLIQAMPDDLATDLQAARERQLAFAGDVTPHEVSDVERVADWHGWVYNFDTGDGFYLTGIGIGIVSGNCRCTLTYSESLDEAGGVTAAAAGGGAMTITEALVAAAIPPKSTPVVDRPWDGPGNVAKIPNDAGASVLRGMYAFVRSGADPNTKAAYDLPHHEVVNGKPGAANIAGVRNAMGRAAQIKPALSSADMAGVRAHLQRHIDDFNKSKGNAAVIDGQLELAATPTGVKSCSLNGRPGYSGGGLCYTHDGSQPGMDKAMQRAQADAKKRGGMAVDDPFELRPTPLVAAPRPVRFTGVATIEGKIADDNAVTPRVVLPNALSWPEMPVSFMAQTVTAEGHDGAEVAGRVDEFNRVPGAAKTRMRIETTGELTTPFGINEVAPMLDDKTMRYVSVDMGATEWAIVNRSTLAPVPEDQLSLEDLQAGKYALGATSGKVKALTLVPTQAIEGALVSLTASADGSEATIVVPFELSAAEPGLVAAAAPVRPPRLWFETPEPPGKMPLTVSDDGRVFGHIATFDSCHVGFLPSCVPPPKSSSNYAYFHVAELDLDDGSTVTVGKMMWSPSDGGHADRKLTARKASEHYDRTGMAAAYLRVTDGQHGIWACGAINPDLSDQQREGMRRELRLNPPSGDWRPINGHYELICALAVAVPGFPVPRATLTIVASGEDIELEDAIIASSGVIEPDPAALAALEHAGLIDADEANADRKIRVLAARAEGGLDAMAALVDA